MLRGIEERHGRACRTRQGGRCDCEPTYRVTVQDGKARCRRTFESIASAQGWRKDAQVAIKYGGQPPAQLADTLAAVAGAWVRDATAGVIRNKRSDRYKPSAIRAYEAALRLRILPALGDRKLSEIRRVDLQDLADRLLAEGVDASTIQVTFLPLRVIYRRALDREEIETNPTVGLRLPAVRGRRNRFASPAEAAALIAALSARDRPLWATAMYGGLRRGELQALRWGDVDLATGIIRVERGWDAKEGEILPKSRESARTVPIPAVLRDFLMQQRLEHGGGPEALVFGEGTGRPFGPGAVTKRARAAWGEAGLERITLHECRHTFASLMIAAGVNAKALQTYMGHASVTITYDRYGHLMPGNEDEAAALLDAYLTRSDTKARLAQLA